MPDDANYSVGRGKPPSANRFRKGQSGNLKGRPKGARNLKTELSEELSERITVVEGGKKRRVSKGRAILKTSVAKALQGSDKAAVTVFNLAVKTGVHAEAPASEEQVSAGRKALFDRLQARVRIEVEAELRGSEAMGAQNDAERSKDEQHQ